MAKKAKGKGTKIAAPTRKRAHSRPLPGMEDRTIKPLDDVAEEYAAIRDSRIELTQREHDLKINTMRLMKKYEKTIYKHDGIEITIVPGEDDVKVRVKKTSDDDDDVAVDDKEVGAEFAAERRAAVDAQD